MDKLEWCGYPIVKHFEDMFIHFDRICECDRRMDGRTLRVSIGCTCIASHDKKH